MKEKQYVGYEIHTLDNMIGRMIHSYHTKLNEAEGLTKMQTWIIRYLFEHQDEAMFQKDIEAQFEIARSTATGILQLMEKNGFLERRPHPDDARLKHLVLTEKSIALQLRITEHMKEMERLLSTNIPKEDMDVFFRVIYQIKSNIEHNR